MTAFAVLRELLIVPVRTMGPCWPGIALSRLWGEGACALCPKSRAQRLLAWPSEVYPTGKRQ